MKIRDTSLSRLLPAVSHIPWITVIRFLGFRPAFGRGEQVERKRERAPIGMGTVRALAEAMILPVRLVAIIAEEVKEQAEEERGT